MASPFSVFRRNQKTLLAVLTLLAMISFLFVPPLLEIMNNRQKSVASGVVATTKYEDIGPNKLRTMLETRYKLNLFMANAIHEAFGFPMEQPFFGSTDEKDVVNTLLMARKAEEMGVVVTDESVRNFLRVRFNQRLQDEQLQQLMTSSNLTGQQLFDGLRQELLAQSVRETLLMPVVQVGSTPAQRWDYYQRLNRRAKIEAVGLKVIDFAKEVPDPDAQELARFFEKHKDIYWEPGSSEPGFHRPKRVQLEYLKAERTTFFQPEAISQADVEAHYEKHKDTRYLFSGAAGEPPVEEPAAEAPAAETPAETPATDAPAAETPAAETPASEPPAAEAPAETPAGDAPAATPPAETPAAPEADAAQTPAAETPAAPDAPAATPEANTPPGGGGDDAGAPPTDTPPAADAAAAPAGEGAAAPTAVTDVPAATPSTEVGSDLTMPTDITAAPDPKYDPLWKVDDRIRRELASQRAAKSMNEVMRTLQAELNNYTTRHAQWELNKQGEEPKRPDFSALAAANGLVGMKTDLISSTEALLSLDIARSSVAGADPFVRFAFEGNTKTFVPSISEDNEGNQYLFWKTDEQPDFVPKLEDQGIRDEVQAAWKTVKARELALAKGRDLLAKARDAKEMTLRERFAPDGYDVVEAGPFSWLTYGSVDPFSPQTPPRLSAVPGLDQIGPEFMRQLFKLKPGELTVVMNNPQTIAYLVRVVGLEPSDEVLHATFLADNFQRYRLAGLDDARMVSTRWFDRLGEDAGLDWAKPNPNEAQEP